MRIKEGYIIQKLGAGYVVVTVGKASKDFNGMIRMNTTGAFLWQSILDGQDTREKLLKAMLEHYEDLDDENVIYTFYDEDGNWHSISEFRGKAVYINFFTTWCTYCFYELPDMEDIAHDSRDDAVVIMIDLDEGPEWGIEYAEDYDVNIPIYYVDSWEIEGMEIEAVPLSIIIDRYGMVIGNHLGQADYNWMEDTIEDAIDSQW